MADPISSITSGVTSAFSPSQPLACGELSALPVELASQAACPVDVSLGDGEVLHVPNEPGGLTAAVDGKDVVGICAHLSHISIHKGDSLKLGGQVGLSGDNGVSSGPHLHYEARVDGTARWPTYRTEQTQQLVFEMVMI